MERARTQLLSQIELTLNSSERVGLLLSDWAAMGDWRLMFLHRDRLRAVKTADVQRVWANYLKPSNRTAGLFYPTPTPDRAEMPASPDVAALVKDYKGDAAREVGEEFDPSTANIEARTTRKKLPGGLELALLPKKTRGGTVFAGMALRFGDLEEPGESRRHPVHDHRHADARHQQTHAPADRRTSSIASRRTST